MSPLAHEAENGVEPIILQHGLQGWPPAGPNVFRWENEQLQYILDSRLWSVTPTSAEWRSFWDVCDQVELWSWPESVGENVFDGLSYHLEIAVGSKSVVSWGQCVGSPPGFRDKLMTLHRALQTLTGWTPTTGIDPSQ